MVENFNDVTAAFNGWLQTVTGFRYSGSYVNGRYVETSSVISFPAVVQNAAPDDLETLPEGNQNDETIKLHTKSHLIPQIEGQQNGDIILYNGKNYRVFSVADRFIGGYFKALAVKQDD